MRYKILLSYDGSSFHGWQLQNNAPTIQGCIQESLSKLLNEEISVTGAGRTDTEVNAICYAAHFDSPEEGLDAKDLVYKLNAILNPKIVIHSIEKASSDFHSRFDAQMREYHYFINKKKDPFIENYSWRCSYNIDLTAMNKAAEYLVGTKDFSCFEKKGGSNKTSICTIYDAIWQPYYPSHVSLMGYPCNEGDYIFFRIRADRFLRNMVRAIVGTLIDIGRGKHNPEWIQKLLIEKNRSSAGESVPGNALFLSKVSYDNEIKIF